MTPKELRWSTAQTYEKNWWQNHVDSLQLEFYRFYAEEAIRELNDLIPIDQNTVVLEIGSGAAGILTFLPSAHRHAIDPLEDFYSTVTRFVQFRDKEVKYYTMKAEQLEFPDAAFDLIINDNVLDHCENPLRVLQEMRRVLKPNGVVYLRLVTFHLWGKLIRATLEKFQIDQGHPHTFTKKSITWAVNRSGFTVIRTSSAGYFRTWRNDLLSGTLKGFLKAALFATRDKTLYILKKLD